MKSTNKTESLNAAIQYGEQHGLKQGFGEILDDGQLSKAEVAATYHIVTADEMEDAINAKIAEIKSLSYLFGDPSDAELDRDNIRQQIEARNARYQAMIDAAPEQHIYDYQYYA